MHTAKDNYIGLGFGGLDAQFQGVAAKVGNILYFGGLVVMCQDNGIFFFGQ